MSDRGTDEAGTNPLSPLPLFDREIAPELREQLLRYHISGVLSDVERARLFGLPATARMREGAKILSPEKLKCGEFVWIGEGAILDASGGLEIGSHTSIGLGVFVWTHSSHLLNRSLENIPHSPKIERKPTRIGTGCFIAGPSVILPGVTVGDRSIITPMSVVDKDVPEGQVFSARQEISNRMKGLESQLPGLLKRMEALEQLLNKK